MEEALDALEERIAGLRRAVRAALAQRDSARAAQLRAELRRAERAWDAMLSPTRPSASALSTIREQVHQGLTLLGAPAAPKLITAAHQAFFPSRLASPRMTSLRRDEERSYRSTSSARPYYLCPALTADLLTPVRGLLAISTWPLHRRIVGPLSARVDYLTAAARIAEAAAERGISPAEGSAVERLLSRFARNIPGAEAAALDPQRVRTAAQAELKVHTTADESARRAAARRARSRLGDAEQLFGSRLSAVRNSAT